MADTEDRADLAEDRPGHRLDRFDGAAESERGHGRRRAQRDRVRRCRRSPVRDREVLAEGIRDQDRSEGSVGSVGFRRFQEFTFLVRNMNPWHFLEPPEPAEPYLAGSTWY